MYSIRATAPSVVSGGGRKRADSASSVENRHQQQKHQQQQQQQQGVHATALATAAGEPTGEEATTSRSRSASINSSNSDNPHRPPQHLVPKASDQSGGMNFTSSKREMSINNRSAGFVVKRHPHQYPQQMANREALTPKANTSRSSAAMVSNGSPNPVRRTTPGGGGGGSRTQPSTPKRRGGTMSSLSSSAAAGTPTTTATGTRIINSPLIDAPPTPTPDASKERLIKHDDRWRAMSQLAGSHRQSARLLDLSNRSLPPEALKYGVPPKTAGMVTELRYDGNLVGKDDLPSFLDIVVPLFPRLQHISLRNNPCCPATVSTSRAMDNGDSDGDDEEPIPDIDPKLKKKLDAAIEAADREQVRMQRLYIIYRLPDLLSIDGVNTTAKERHLARPLTPVGTPVKKDDWLTKAMATMQVDVGIGVSDGYDSASSGGAKAGVRGASKAEKGQGDTCSDIVPSETGGTTMSAVEVSLSGLANYVRTEHKDLVAETSSSSDSASSYDDYKRARANPNLKAVTLVRTNRSLPPPSPASRLRTFPVPRQKKRRSGSGSSTNKSSAAARQLWRQRNKNVASMVDNESDEESTDEEEELEKGKPAAVAGAAEEGNKKANDQDEEAMSSADWSGTMGMISNMED
mmetsp:Transcript_977/g.2065  ORF Transcript_977/g.2065 Transcript_977/m.2065 type:complete len:632 (+) Transcript_977:238-2133(+)